MDCSTEISSDDGVLNFTVRQVPGAVQVVRRHRIQQRGMVTFVFRFNSEAEFTRFCEEDELRFVYQSTIEKLRRMIGVVPA